MSLRTCVKCQKTKPTENFAHRRGKPTSTCRACWRAYCAKYKPPRKPPDKRKRAIKQKCLVCKVTKASSEFKAVPFSQTWNETGLLSRCKECLTLARKAKAAGKKFCSKCRRGLGKAEFHSRATYCKKCLAVYSRTQTRWWRIKKVYGLTKAQFTAILKAQQGRCPICSRSLRSRIGIGTRQRDACHVDHDHKTGAVRGILCSQCNCMLGLASDSPVTLTNAIAYLERSGQ